MAVTDYSTVPGSNTTISGINIAETCPPGNINDAFRQIMADVRVMYNNLPSVAGKADASGAVFSGTQPIYTGRGAMLHHSSAANASGKVSILPTGSANPASPSNGEIVFFYTP